jgi:cell wall-associated NlpC family hydrolase
MSTDRGLRGAPDRAPGIRIAAPLALLLALVTAALMAPAANADTIAAKRQEANRVYGEIVASQQQLEGVVQKYDAATLQLRTTKRAISSNKLQLSRARHNLKRARSDLEGALIAAYKRGQPDALQAVLASKSLSQMFDEINLMKRATTFNATTVQSVRTYRLQVIQHERELTLQRTERAKAVREQAARRAQISYAIHQQTQTLENVKSDIRHLVYARQQAEIAAARARALAASRTLQATRSSATVLQSQTSGLTAGLGAQADSQSAPDTGTPDAASSDATQTAPPASSAAAQAAQVALGEQGVPYVWAGSSPSGFDCSGLVAWAFSQVGISLPHSSYALYNVGTHIARSDLQPGDLVFFSGLGHVGIYIGGGQFVHAPHTGDVVRVAGIDSGEGGPYVGAVRVG